MQSTNAAMQPSTSGNTFVQEPAEKRPPSTMDNFYQKSAKARAVAAPKNGNSPMFKPLPLQNPSMALNATLANVPASKEPPKSVGMKIVTGTIAKILRTHKDNSDVNALYEVFGMPPTIIVVNAVSFKHLLNNFFTHAGAKVLSLRNGNGPIEKLLLVRNETGPVMQAVYYEIDYGLPNIAVGSSLRIIGRLIGINRMQILKMSVSTAASHTRLATRLETISSFIIDNDRESRL